MTTFPRVILTEPAMFKKEVTCYLFYFVHTYPTNQSLNCMPSAIISHLYGSPCFFLTKLVN